MEKDVFIGIVREIVEGFEGAEFRAAFAAAKAKGDVAALTSLPLGIQERAFAKHGLDPADALARFKQAGRGFGTDPEVAPLLARLKAAL